MMSDQEAGAWCSWAWSSPAVPIWLLCQRVYMSPFKASFGRLLDVKLALVWEWRTASRVWTGCANPLVPESKPPWAGSCW